MACFSDLPNEIIHQILGFVELEDLENIAQLSRNIFVLSTPFLQEHKALVRQYDVLNSRGSPSEARDGIMSGSIPRLLKDVLLNPCLGGYVRKVEIACLTTSDALLYKDEHERNSKRYYQQINLFKQAVERTELVFISDGFHDIHYMALGNKSRERRSPPCDSSTTTSQSSELDNGEDASEPFDILPNDSACKGA